jgi:hypothetical protein
VAAGGGDGGRAAVEKARQRAHAERQRAARAAGFAVRHEELSAAGLSPQLTAFHSAMAAAHRRTEQRHLVASRLHQDHAQHLERWTRGESGATQPGLITSIASTAGSRSATLTLLDRSNTEALVAASDATSRAAHDLELTFAEGPSRDAIRDPVLVRAAGSGLAARWPHYGPALGELGVHAVAAVGLRTSQSCLGSLTIFDPHPTPSGPVIPEVTAVAQAVLHSVLLAPDALQDAEGLPTLTDFDNDDVQPVLHQAAGKIHAANGCGVETGLALIHTHAYAEDRPAATVAHDVLRGVLTLP